MWCFQSFSWKGLSAQSFAFVVGLPKKGLDMKFQYNYNSNVCNDVSIFSPKNIFKTH